jgi:hypothetical protein
MASDPPLDARAMKRMRADNMEALHAKNEAEREIASLDIMAYIWACIEAFFDDYCASRDVPYTLRGRNRWQIKKNGVRMMNCRRMRVKERKVLQERLEARGWHAYEWNQELDGMPIVGIMEDEVE